MAPATTAHTRAYTTTRTAVRAVVLTAIPVLFFALPGMINAMAGALGL